MIELEGDDWPPVPMARSERMVVDFILHGCVLSKVVSSMDAWVIHPHGDTNPRLRYVKNWATGGRKKWHLMPGLAGQRTDKSLVPMDWHDIPKTLLVAIPFATLKAFFEAL